MNQKSMWIMIAGPYGFGAGSEQDRLANLGKLNRMAVEIFRKGHIPIIGVNMALPMIEAAGSSSYAEIMMPLSLSLCDRCDAIFRVEGESVGADKEVAEFKKHRKTVYQHLDEIPFLIK